MDTNHGSHHLNREKALLNYKKAKGTLEKLILMTDSDAYCIDIMKQSLAAAGLIRSAQQMLLEDHLRSCFRNAMETGSEKKKQEMIREILSVSRLSDK